MEAQDEVGLFQAARWRALAAKARKDAELFDRVADKYERKEVASRSGHQGSYVLTPPSGSPAHRCTGAARLGMKVGRRSLGNSSGPHHASGGAQAG